MFTRSQYAAFILAVSFAATSVVANPTILLNPTGVLKHKVSTTVTPPTTIPNNKIAKFAGLNAAASVSPVTTDVAAQIAGLEKESNAAIGEVTPEAVSTRRGFSAPVKKKRGTSAKRSLESRAETSDFNSTIVDSWLMVLSVGTPPQQLE